MLYLLKKNFRDGFLTLYDIEKKSFLNDEEVKIIGTLFPNRKCIASHHIVSPLPQLENMKVSYLPFTFLRNPVDRIISNYLFNKFRHEKGIIKKEGPHSNFKDWFDYNNEKGYKVSNGKWTYLSEMQLYYIDRSNDLAKAKKRLAEDFVFTGIAERFNESLLIMKDKFLKHGTYFDINYLIKNVTPKAGAAVKEKEMILEKYHDYILGMNQKEMELYEFAIELLDKEISSYKNFDRELENYKKRLKFLKYFLRCKEIGERVLMLNR